MEARTVLVGREAEGRELAAAIEGAAAGSPGAAIVGGEAGVGKTRLVTEVTGAAERQGVAVLWGRCLRFGTAESSFQPIGQLLTQWFRQADGAERARVLHGLPVGRLTTIAPVLGDPAGDESGQLIPLLATLLERISDAGALAVVIDDLQWADTTSLDLLAYVVAGFGPGQRLAVIGTYRDSDLHEGHRLHGWLADVRRLPMVIELHLGPLGLPETEELVASLCGEEGAVARGAAVFERSRGNPYLAELLALAPAADSVADGGLKDALLSSWHRLSPSTRQVAQLLAVGGRPVDRSILEQLARTRDLSSETIRGSVVEILGAGIATATPAGQVWFRHPLIAEVLVSTISSGELEEIHREYARLWEQATRAPVALRAAHLALHHDGAHHDDEAFEWSLRAAEAAAVLYSWAEECEHLHRACRLWPSVNAARHGSDADRVLLLGRASESAIRAGEYRLALELREEALRLVDGRAHPLGAAEHHFRVEFLRIVCGVVAFDEVSPEIKELAESAPDSAERAIALALLARSESFSGGQSARGVRHAEEAVRVARRCGSDEALAWALGVRSWAGYQTQEGLKDAELAIAHARACGDRVLLAWTAMWRKDWLQGAGLKATAADRTLEIYRELSATGSVYECIWLLSGIGYHLVELGRWAEARDLLREAMSRRITFISGAGIRYVAADLAARAGDLSAARQHLTRARELAPRRQLVGDPSVPAQMRVAIALGDQVSALSLMAEAMPDLRAIDEEAADELLVWAARAAADLAAKPGEHAHAVAWLEKIDDLRGEMPPRFVVRSTDDLIHPAWARLFAAEGARCHDGGSRRPELWEEATAACATAGLPWERALCSYRLAQALLRTNGGRSRAAAALREAARIASELGAAPILADVESLAVQSHIPLTEPDTTAPSSQTPPAFAGLTQREAEVLRHLVAGRTYAEIARELFISEKTVSVHVTNVLRKTGTSSRIEVTDLARRLRFQ
ncbi:MAG TPA: AAA family ATPase [Intrasporangium sp.]|nr:AAA family ATPase [Intrasporangium sp.]